MSDPELSVGQSDMENGIAESKTYDISIVNLNLNLSDENESPLSPLIKSSTTNNESKPEASSTFSLSSSQDKLTCSGKKCQKMHRKGDTCDLPLLTKLVVKSFISQNSIRDSQSNRKLYEIYPNPDELCDDCRWLVKATKSTESMRSSSEDEEYVTKWINSRKSVKNCKENNLTTENSSEIITKVYNKETVLELLNEAHSRLLECNILLTTKKLQKKLRKPGKEKETGSETSLNDDWFDQIQAEDDTKDGASKLCLVLERLVAKYLKCESLNAHI